MANSSQLDGDNNASSNSERRAGQLSAGRVIAYMPVAAVGLFLLVGGIRNLSLGPNEVLQYGDMLHLQPIIGGASLLGGLLLLGLVLLGIRRSR